MKYISLILIYLFLSCSTVEQRIKEHSYTTEWYYHNSTKYQVYKTQSGRKYILLLNRNNSRFKRVFLDNLTRC
jgi:hypothetical protein